MVARPELPRLQVRTQRVQAPADPLLFAHPDAPMVWSRRGDWLIGAGAAALTLSASGADRAHELAARWREVSDAAAVIDEVSLPGTGLVAFGALAFDDRSASASTLTVPSVIIGRRGADAWMTTVTVSGDDTQPAADSDASLAAATLPEPTEVGGPWSATLGPGTLDPAGYEAAVRQGLDAIASQGLRKIVLARDLVGTAPAHADLRRLVHELADSYPDCWTFSVDGIIGASPETLLSVHAGRVSARVLAGTIARGPDDVSDHAAATALNGSDKDQREHAFAVQSLLTTLAPHADSLCPDGPFLLKLPNVWHLATDVAGVLSDEASSLDLVSAVAPTAAVAGTPTIDAMDAIARIEPFDRGRYAGAVGWTDAAGDGEWAIALRCVQHSPAADGSIMLTAHAGAGIVAASDPESELMETRVKFRPIVEALA